MAEVVVWGASGHARVVADAARLQGHVVAGFLDDNPSRRGEAFAGATVLGGTSSLEELRANGLQKLHVAVGNCAARWRLAGLAEQRGFDLVTIVHPRATVAVDATIGAGTFLAAGTVVNSGAVIGRLAILNTGCTVDHDCVVGNGAHVGPGVHIGGAAELEELVWVGIGATLRDRVKVGQNSIIGAGAVVVSNIQSDVVAFGVPARVVRPRKAGE